MIMKKIAVYPPTPPIEFEKTHYSISLKWKASTTSSRCLYYELLVQEVDSEFSVATDDRPWKGNWKVLESRLDKTLYVVSNLKPLRRYIFRVREYDVDSGMWTPYSDLSRIIKTNRRM